MLNTCVINYESLSVGNVLERYLHSPEKTPLVLAGDSLQVLRSFPDSSMDFCMTSPPYWGHRQYESEGVGLENTYVNYINNLMNIFREVYRVLKDEGSFWLNIGDSYHRKMQLGIPWRLAIRMMDEQGWILRNDVIWNKVKGAPDNSKDKLRNIHEYLFHFVKCDKYYYDVDSIRSKPRSTRIVNGATVSATGVSGVRYKRQIELSTSLTEEEKIRALEALNIKLLELKKGDVVDFRMIIRGQQRATHSDSENVSGRAKELKQNGFYFLNYHKEGAKPSDVWEILPEDTQGRKTHYAPYPEDLCKIPILATCPANGTVLDPFCGTGTTLKVAFNLDRKSIGIDISEIYAQIALERCTGLI